MDSVATMRPMSTQAVFRPNFDDDDDVVRSEPIEIEGKRRPNERWRRPVDSAVAWWRFHGCRRSTHWQR